MKIQLKTKKSENKYERCVLYVKNKIDNNNNVVQKRRNATQRNETRTTYRGKNELKQQHLIETDKVGIPLLHNIGHVLRLERFFNLRHGFRQVMFAKFNHLDEHGTLDIRQWNFNLLLAFGFLCQCKVKCSINQSINQSIINNG
jgi:hypothetical protein